MPTVTLRNLTNGPFDIPTLKGSVFLPAYGEASSDAFDPDYLSILESSGNVTVGPSTKKTAALPPVSKGKKAAELPPMPGTLPPVAAPAALPPVTTPEPAALPPVTPKSVETLRAEAEAAGVEVDKRWGAARLQKEIDAASKKKKK